MSGTHEHNHHHGMQSMEQLNKAFTLGIVLNLLFVALEFIIGYSTSSLALVSDAGHNLTDVFSLLLSLLAFRMMRVKPSERYSYGYKKASILISLLNAVLLLAAVAVIFYESAERFSHPHVVKGDIVSLIAGIGILINGLSAWLFMRSKDRDLNVKGAYLHLLSDALVSAGVVVSGVLIYFTGLYWIDALASIVIGLVILVASWRLLADSLRLALDGTPRGVDVSKVKELIMTFPVIHGVHHVHIWAMSSSQNALTAHLVIDGNDLEVFETVKEKIRHELEHLNIHHATFEIETGPCKGNCEHS